MMSDIPFIKMNGLGNDFAIFDARERPLSFSAKATKLIADRNNGVGCDQVIVMEPSSNADVFMRIFNADGSEVEACGNATRCVARLVAGERAKIGVTIETGAGVLVTELNGAENVTVDMGVPKFDWQDIPLSEEFAATRRIELQVGPVDDPVLHTPSVVNVGNPHCIFFVDDVRRYDLAGFGSMLEYHMLFPERANISLAEIKSKTEIKLIVWERGAGLTKACGTGACAAAVAAARIGYTGRNVTVHLPGGDLMIYWRESDDHILMTGPIEFEFKGEIDAASFELDCVAG